MAVIKHSFGGLGTNWVNPALGAWLFVRFTWPGAFTQALEGSPLMVLTENHAGGLQTGGLLDPQGSLLGSLNQASQSPPGNISGFLIPGFSGITRGLYGVFNALDGNITSFLNKTIFSLTGAELPEGYIGLLFFTGNGIIADRGLLGILLGSMAITALHINRFWMPAVFLGVYALVIRFFGVIPFGGDVGGGDVLFALFSGATIATAFLMITDPVTGPKSRLGAGLIAALAALGAFIFRYLGFEPYGALYAVALANVLVPLIRDFENWGKPGGAV
jgi:electron transport complex protein RnfD